MNQKKMHQSFFFSPSTVNLNKVQGIEVKKKKKIQAKGILKRDFGIGGGGRRETHLKKNKQIVANI